MTEPIPLDTESQRARIEAAKGGALRGVRTRRKSVVAMLGLLGAALSSQPSSAQPAAAPPSGTAEEPSRAQCLESHQKAQEFKRTSKLLEARQELAICSAVSCPGALIVDCGNWIGEIERDIPSLVFEVTLDGKPASNAKLFVDGQPVLDIAQAVKVNPGRHSIRAELATLEPHIEELVLAAGTRTRVITIQFRSPQVVATAESQSAPSPALTAQFEPQVARRPTPILVYPLLGVGALGLASFGVFSLVGNSRQSDLEDECEPSCSDDDLSSMKTAYLLGDVSAGVGAAALIFAGVVYFTRPEHKVGAAGTPTFAVVPVGNGPLRLSSFGVVMTETW